MENNYYAVERSGNSLSHYGVKGMKWGVRKAASKLGKKIASIAKSNKDSGKTNNISINNPQINITKTKTKTVTKTINKQGASKKYRKQKTCKGGAIA